VIYVSNYETAMLVISAVTLVVAIVKLARLRD